MITNVRVLSDIHLEFSDGWMDVPEMENDSDTVLILAGDVGVADKPATYVRFLQSMSDRFLEVIYVLGNHEMYHTSYNRALDKIQQQVDSHGLTNVQVCERRTVIVGNTAFVCATLWTDMNDCDPFTMYDIVNRLNDFRLIRVGPPDDPYQRLIKPRDLVADHKLSKQFIFDEIAVHKDLGYYTVVVTHHGPSHLSVHEIFVNDRVMTGAFVSELGNDIAYAEGPNVWIHGHTHFSFDYPIHKTRVIVNPRGYAPDDLNPEFDPRLSFTLPV